MLYGGSELAHGEAPPTGWEYVLVFRAPAASAVRGGSSGGLSAESAARAATLERLRGAGFAYSQVWAPAQGAVLVRLALPEATLRARAEDTGIELELLARCGGGFLSFKAERAQHYVNQFRPGFFTPEERLRVTLDVLGSSAGWGAAIDVEKLRHQRLLRDAYPVHDRAVRRHLLRHAVRERWWDPTHRPDFTRLKDYLGTRMALYFAFLAFYTRMLTGIALASVPVYFLMTRAALPPTALAAVRVCFGAGLVFWAAYFLKYWARRNAIVNVKWGTADFNEDSHNKIRPQYVGQPRHGFYSKGGFVPLGDLAGQARGDVSSGSSSDESDDESYVDRMRRRFRADPDFELEEVDTGLVLRGLPAFPYCDKKTLRSRVYLSVFMTFLFAMIMVSLNFLLIFYTAEITAYFSGHSWGPALPGILTGVLIFLCDNGWKEISKALSKWENQRTNQAFQNSGIVKRFAFQFISNYFSLFYIAFIKPYTPDDACVANPADGRPDCMLDLEIQLASLVITKATIQQVLELGIPSLIIAIKRVRMWFLSRRSGDAAVPLLRASVLSSDSDGEETDVDYLEESKLDTYRNSREDYGELVIQYGYIALFGLAYPPAAIVCLINNLIEMRSDAFKLLYISKRVPAFAAADIGKWAAALKLISAFAVWTNAGLITFTANRATSVITDVSFRDVVAFFVLKHLLFWLKEAIENAVSDIPGRTIRRKARQEYLIYRWFGIGERPYYKQNMAAQLDELEAVKVQAKSDIVSQELNADLLIALDSTEEKTKDV